MTWNPESPDAAIDAAVGDYVLVYFRSKKTIQLYVALILNIEGTECEVLCLRKTDSSGRVICFTSKIEFFLVNFDTFCKNFK